MIDQVKKWMKCLSKSLALDLKVKIEPNKNKEMIYSLIFLKRQGPGDIGR